MLTIIKIQINGLYIAWQSDLGWGRFRGWNQYLDVDMAWWWMVINLNTPSMLLQTVRLYSKMRSLRLAQIDPWGQWTVALCGASVGIGSELFKRCIPRKSPLKIIPAPNTTLFLRKQAHSSPSSLCQSTRQIIQCFHNQQQHQHTKAPTEPVASCGGSISPHGFLVVSIFIGQATSHRMPSAKVASLRTHQTNSQPKSNS